jgi:hypothetical protein
MIVVIPSNRSVNLDHLTPLIEYGARFIVIDDTKGCIKINHPQFAVYNWADRKRLLGRNEVAVPKNSGTCRDLGFYIAWKEGDDDEIVVALDDDCVVEPADFPEQVESVLRPRVRQAATGPGRHFNIFDIYEGVDSRRVFPRGFPYSQRVTYQRWNLDQAIQSESHFNVGLWKGIFDINAIDKIRLSQTNFPNAELIYDSVIIPRGVLVSACAANLHFRRSLIPAAYQLPMNLAIMPSWPLNRYGDIWGGFILKMLMDIRVMR